MNTMRELAYQNLINNLQGIIIDKNKDCAWPFREQHDLWVPEGHARVHQAWFTHSLQNVCQSWWDDQHVSEKREDSSKTEAITPSVNVNKDGDIGGKEGEQW